MEKRNGAAAGRKKHLVNLRPETLVFDMTEVEPVVTLHLENVCTSIVAFKIKTTHPQRYHVFPSQDVLPVDGNSCVKITFHRKQAAQLREAKLMRNEDTADEWKNTRFKILCTIVGPAHLAEISEHYHRENYKELNATLNTMWYSDTTQNCVVSRILNCVFNFPTDTAKLLRIDNQDDATPPSDMLSMPSKIGTEDGKKSMNFGSGVSPTDDPKELCRKYLELVSFSVQLTAERDRYKAAVRTLNAELEILKNGGSPSADFGKLEKALESMNSRTITNVAGYRFWQVIAVAIFAFLIGFLFS